MTTASELADELERMFAQFRSDLSTAHEEICKLQGLNPMEQAWPEWSPQANTLRWIDRSGPLILSSLRRVEKLEGALRRAQQFIVNGTELGFIRMPETIDDPAHLTLPAIRQALTGEAR